MLTARLNSAQPIAGINYELDAIAATVIGGTSLMGGEGTLGGTLVGALIMGVLRNGLNLLGVSSFLQQIVIGGVIVVAVLLERFSRGSIVRRPGPSRRRPSRYSACDKRTLALILASRRCRYRAIAKRRTRANGDQPTVALVLKTLNHPFFVDMRRGAQEAADRLGVNLQVQAAEREIDVEKQMQIVENMIQTGIQALVITPSGSREIVSALVKAKNAKVPIIVVDTRVDAKAAADAGVTTATFVGSDNYAGGKLAGEYLVKATGGKAHVAILEGIPGHETGDSRLRGFRDAVKDAAGHHDRRLAAGELGARSGLQRVPEHAAGASRHRQRVRLQRPDGARRDRGDRRRRQDRQDQGDRLRRARRCEEGDCGGDDGGVGGAVSVGDGQGRGRERGEGDSRRERSPADISVKLELVTKDNVK